MDPSELDAALLSMTDAQINAAFIRRARAKEAIRRQQSAERMARMRGRWRDADRDAGVTPDVTQKNGNSTRASYAKRDAGVTPGVTPPDTATVPPMVSPCPPSFPPPPPVTRGSARNLPALPAALAAVPGFEAEWADYTAHRRQIRKPLTPVAATRLLKTFAKRPADAIAGLDLAMSQSWQGFDWRWFDDRRDSASTPNNPNPHNRNAAHQTNLPFGRGQVDRNAGTVNARRSGQYAGLGTVFTGRKA